MMRKRIVISAMLVLFCEVAVSQCNNICNEIKHIRDVPYIPELQEDCPDSIYWALVKEGLNIIPTLIKCIDITDSTQIIIPNWGGHYTVGDIAFSIICDIIHGLPLQDFFKKGIIDTIPTTYHSFICSSKRNKQILQNQLRRWYKENHRQLVWVTDHSTWRIADDCWLNTNEHPAGGYYTINY
jgi:hypothetical protein